MPDASPPASDTRPQATAVSSVSGLVIIDVRLDTNTGGDVVGCTVEQVGTRLAQINCILEPKPFNGRCPNLNCDGFSRAESLLGVRSDQRQKTFVAQEVDIE